MEKAEDKDANNKDKSQIENKMATKHRFGKSYV
jgi:hypothetical protein